MTKKSFKTVLPSAFRTIIHSCLTAHTSMLRGAMPCRILKFFGYSSVALFAVASTGCQTKMSPPRHHAPFKVPTDLSDKKIRPYYTVPTIPAATSHQKKTSLLPPGSLAEQVHKKHPIDRTFWLRRITQGFTQYTHRGSLLIARPIKEVSSDFSTILNRAGFKIVRHQCNRYAVLDANGVRSNSLLKFILQKEGPLKTKVVLTDGTGAHLPPSVAKLLLRRIEQHNGEVSKRS